MRGGEGRGQTEQHTRTARGNTEGQKTEIAEEEAAGGGREDSEDTREKQSRQAQQGADRMKRNMRHNETFKCAMMVAWTSGRVRVKRCDRTAQQKRATTGRH